MKLIVTGNIGCGKSTVIDFLKENLLDYHFFDFDITVHGLYEDKKIQLELLNVFDTFERKKISDIVYQDEVKMEKLKSIFDSNLIGKVQEAAKNKNIVLDIPLYFEHLSSWGLTIDKVLCVSTTVENQIMRVKKRNNFSQEKILKIMAKQMETKEKEKMADFVIENNGTQEELKEKVLLFVKNNILKENNYKI